jgi:phenylalanyl-tRNA synthetase alpha chain
MQIKVESKEEQEILKTLTKRQDAEGKRIIRFLEMPDLTRSADSPLYELIERILAIEDFKNFDVIQVPEIASVDVHFNLFNFPPDHPARSRSDTYYADDNHILRTHTTVMWYYYLQHKEIKKKIAKNEAVGALSYGKVYRKDEIDRNHMNVFHQIDGWYLVPAGQKIITMADLKDILVKIVQAIFGKDVKYRFNEETFPFTDPSIEVEVEVGGKWIEVVGSGVVRGSVLKNLGVDPEKYNGWAFGFGLERLAIISMELPDIRLFWSKDIRVKKQLRLDNKFKEVSKYPPITRDISFVVRNNFIPNNYFDLIRDLGGDLVEEVKLLDKYENQEKFGKDKLSYTYRIIYRSNDRTLTNEEVDKIQAAIYSQTAEQFAAELR